MPKHGKLTKTKQTKISHKTSFGNRHLVGYRRHMTLSSGIHSATKVFVVDCGNAYMSQIRILNERDNQGHRDISRDILGGAASDVTSGSQNLIKTSDWQ
jgi:hypothetical protein